MQFLPKSKRTQKRTFLLKIIGPSLLCQRDPENYVCPRKRGLLGPVQLCLGRGCGRWAGRRGAGGKGFLFLRIGNIKTEMEYDAGVF